MVLTKANTIILNGEKIWIHIPKNKFDWQWECVTPQQSNVLFYFWRIWVKMYVDQYLTIYELWMDSFVGLKIIRDMCHVLVEME